VRIELVIESNISFKSKLPDEKCHFDPNWHIQFVQRCSKTCLSPLKTYRVKNWSILPIVSLGELS
jgi:hypothetical protein